MNILGIIAEYNPFHNGHQYHLEKSKALTEADGVICVMSSNFLQRGEPALIDKWERTQMALFGGADLVIELPAPYALRSAEFFAYGAVSLLEATGLVKYVSFGSESGNLEKMKEIASVLAKEPTELSQYLYTYLDEGLSYPSARTQALIDYLQEHDQSVELDFQEVEDLTSNPNNILGLEYLKAIQRLGSRLKPVTIPRIAASFHDKEIDGQIASATAIREDIFRNLQEKKELLSEKTLQAIPHSTGQILKKAFATGKGPISIEDFAPQVLTLLRRADEEDIAQLYDVRGGLENRIKEAVDHATSIRGLIELVKTKRYTWTRIQRIIFHFLLRMTSLQCEYFDQLGGPQYIRILGFTPRGRRILARMKETAELPIITRIANHYQRPETADPVDRMLELEIRTTNLYSLATPNPDFRIGNRDLLEKVIIAR